MEMYRKIINQFVDWKNNPNKKPLIVSGARQVGKTWAIKNFAKKYYKDYIYINFETEKLLTDIFIADLNPKRIIKSISLILKKEITPQTLIIFDEIQSVEKGVSALKYFYEQAPEYQIISAGSLLGIAMHFNDSFPVGKVDTINMYPMDFEEFLMATGNQKIAKLLFEKDFETSNIVHEQITQLLKTYYFVGGMPEVVGSFVENNNFETARKIQKNILSNYENDFSKHAPSSQLPKIRLVYNVLLSQLSKENKKFVYGLIRKGARASEFENALLWLKDAGIIHIVNRCKSGEIPLKAFEDFNSFKVFFVDMGLLCALGDIDSQILLQGDQLFSTFKGAMTEQYVFQQMICNKKEYYSDIHYWSSEKSDGEIDFLIQGKNKIIPIEVKAEENLKSKSLKSFIEKYKIEKGLRFSMAKYREQDWLINIPLYYVGFYF